MIYALWNGGPSYRPSDRHTAGDLETFESVEDAVEEMVDRIANRDGQNPAVAGSSLELYIADPTGDDDYAPDFVYDQVGTLAMPRILAESLDTIVQHYAVCALWSSHDMRHESDPDRYAENLDDGYDVADIAADTMTGMRDDVADFVASNAGDILASELTPEQTGHDFWLTRNGHGAGFWDRGLGELGDRLADAARVYGSVDLFVNDDDEIEA